MMTNLRIKMLLIAIVVPLLSLNIGVAQEKITLRIAWWGSPTRHELTIEVIELYEELNPNIEIEYSPQNWNDHWAGLAEQADEGELPDIMQNVYERIEEWVDNDLLLPLDGYIEGGIIDTSAISDSLLEGGKVDGEIYGINLGNNSEAIALNVGLFEEAGIDLPATDWTWNEFEEIAMKLHEELGVVAIEANITSPNLWKSYYLGCCDQWIFRDDGGALGYEDDQPLIDYFDMLLRLQEAGAMQSYEENVATGGQGLLDTLIARGRAAMGYFWSNQIVAVWDAASDDTEYVLHPLPRPDGGQSQNYIKPSMFFSITKHSEHPEEAAAFIDWFVNSIEANEILSAERGVPTSSVVREELLPNLGKAQTEMFRYLSLIEEDNSAIRPPDPVNGAEVVNNVFYQFFVDPVMYGLASPAEAVADMREEANRVLSQ